MGQKNNSHYEVKEKVHSSWVNEYNIQCDPAKTRVFANFGLLLGSFLYSFFADKSGRRTTILFSTVGCIITLILFWFSYSIYLIYTMIAFLQTFVAGAYGNMAGLGYIEKPNMDEQMAEIAKGDKKNEKKVGFLIGLMFEIQRWEHITTFTGDGEIRNYAYTIIRHVGKKKVVSAFIGTKGAGQLIDELRASDERSISNLQF